jgi:acetyl-CoA acetyltransferase family protein
MDLDPSVVDELIYSTVLLDPRMPNAARELVLRSRLPKSLPAHFISNNCISGLVAASFAAEGIRSGRLRCAIAGGSESMSRPSFAVKAEAEAFFLGLNAARSGGDKLKALLKFRPSMCVPQFPSPKEPSTGLTMGQHCELMAKEFEVARDAQDNIAYLSHANAAKAREAGYLAEEIAPLGGVEQDNIVRDDTSAEKLAKLRPVFDRSEKGTITAGNASPLTDGASAVCLMSEETAKEHGREILGYIEAVEFSAIAPDDGLLMAPALAVPRLMARCSLAMDDVDRFEVHEAFAAQVLANMEVWEKGWSKYPDLRAVGSIPEEKLNVNGGSIAIGHPFAATGGRLLLSLCHELKRSNKETGIISVCAAGAMGAAVLVRRS